MTKPIAAAIAVFVTTGAAGAAGPNRDRAHAAEQQPAPVRDTTTAQRGSGRIRGRVVSVENGTPLRRAIVALGLPSGAEGRDFIMAPGNGIMMAPGNGTYGAMSGYSSPSTNERLVASDAEGRFEFTDLPAGRYTVGASKVGYVTLLYGEGKPREGGRALELGANQAIDDVTIALPLGGVINARVTDDYGEPLNGITVEAQQARYVDGERTFATVSGASIVGLNVTDETGEQRIHGLPPGDYYVVAGQGVDSRFALAGSGRVYIATYYPGGTTTTQAQLVRVVAGQEVNVTIAMSTSRIARISGTVVHQDGTSWTPRSLTITRQVGDSWTSANMAFLPDGTFAMPRFVPGDYWLEVMEPAPDKSGVAFARQPLSITGEDARDVVVVTRTVQTVRGRVVFDTGAPPPNLPTSAIHLRTSVTGPGTNRAGSVNWLDGWSFGILASGGSGVIRLADASGWFLKAVLLDGQDVTDTPIEFGTVASRDLQVVLTQKQGIVTGGVVDAANAPIGQYAVVLFPADASQWNARVRHLGVGRPDQAGRFRIEGLPAGRYLAVAVDAIEVGEERAPDFFRRVGDRATPLTVGEGQSQNLTLRLIDR